MIMTELQLKKLVNSLLGDDSYTSEDKWKLTEYAHFFSEAGNQFISDKLVLTNKTFLENADNLTIFLAKNFFYYPEKQSSDNSKYCLYPDLNVDRNGFC